MTLATIKRGDAEKKGLRGHISTLWQADPSITSGQEWGDDSKVPHDLNITWGGEEREPLKSRVSSVR